MMSIAGFLCLSGDHVDGCARAAATARSVGDVSFGPAGGGGGGGGGGDTSLRPVGGVHSGFSLRRTRVIVGVTTAVAGPTRVIVTGTVRVRASSVGVPPAVAMARWYSLAPIAKSASLRIRRGLLNPCGMAGRRPRSFDVTVGWG